MSEMATLHLRVAFEEERGLRPLKASCLHGDVKALRHLVTYLIVKSQY